MQHIPSQINRTRGFTQLSKVAGFTLVETLVAITILLLVIIGPMTVAQKGIQNAYFANEQVTAVFLAQEAIEGIREDRDIQALRVYDHLVDPPQNGGVAPTAADWFTGDVTECEEGCAYDIDRNGDVTFEQCGEGSCVLRFKDGQYGTDAQGVNSPFTRKIYVTEVAEGTVSVESEVTWGARGNVKLQTWLYNHYARYDE